MLPNRSGSRQTFNTCVTYTVWHKLTHYALEASKSANFSLSFAAAYESACAMIAGFEIHVSCLCKNFAPQIAHIFPLLDTKIELKRGMERD